MKLKDELAQHRLAIMRLRVRGMNTKPQVILQQQLQATQELTTTVVQQRDEFVRKLDKAEAHIKFLENEIREPLPEGDIRALKHRIHELEGELIGYKKIVADQESIMTAQAMRIVDLKTHIENLEGED